MLWHLSFFQAAKERQQIRNQEIEIEVIERRKMIEVEEKEIDRREKELQATVKSPAEAESFRLQTVAEAQKYVLYQFNELSEQSEKYI